MSEFAPRNARRAAETKVSNKKVKKAKVELKAGLPREAAAGLTEAKLCVTRGRGRTLPSPWLQPGPDGGSKVQSVPQSFSRRSRKHCAKMIVYYLPLPSRDRRGAQLRAVASDTGRNVACRRGV